MKFLRNIFGARKCNLSSGNIKESEIVTEENELNDKVNLIIAKGKHNMQHQSFNHNEISRERTPFTCREVSRNTDKPKTVNKHSNYERSNRLIFTIHESCHEELPSECSNYQKDLKLDGKSRSTTQVSNITVSKGNEMENKNNNQSQPIFSSNRRDYITKTSINIESNEIKSSMPLIFPTKKESYLPKVDSRVEEHIERIVRNMKNCMNYASFTEFQGVRTNNSVSLEQAISSKNTHQVKSLLYMETPNKIKYSNNLPVITEETFDQINEIIITYKRKSSVNKRGNCEVGDRVKLDDSVYSKNLYKLKKSRNTNICDRKEMNTFEKEQVVETIEEISDKSISKEETENNNKFDSVLKNIIGTVEKREGITDELYRKIEYSEASREEIEDQLSVTWEERVKQLAIIIAKEGTTPLNLVPRIKLNYCCWECQKYYSTLAELRLHVHSAHYCLKCNVVFSREYKFRIHNYRYHDGFYVCRHCKTNKSFVSGESLAIHYAIVHDGRNRYSLGCWDRKCYFQDEGRAHIMEEHLKFHVLRYAARYTIENNFNNHSTLKYTITIKQTEQHRRKHYAKRNAKGKITKESGSKFPKFMAILLNDDPKETQKLKQIERKTETREMRARILSYEEELVRRVKHRKEKTRKMAEDVKKNEHTILMDRTLRKKRAERKRAEYREAERKTIEENEVHWFPSDDSLGEINTGGCQCYACND